MTRKNSIVFKTAFLLIFIVCLMAGILTANFHFARADSNSNDVRYKKKIVSVLFDNSGSMDLGRNNTELARYSLEMLATLLSEKDELYITPMNSNAYSDGSAFEIKLDSKIKQSEIEEKIINNKALYANGMTPKSSIQRTIDVLTERGLLAAGDSSYTTTNEDTEYWLVMLTDGGFEDYTLADNVAGCIEEYIAGYTGLNSIYLAFGSGAVNLENSYLTKNYPFSAYYVPDYDLLISKMQAVANNISGRYSSEAGSNQYSVSPSGKEIIVDLDNFKFAVNNIAVIVQDCGAKLKSVTYEGNNLAQTQENVLIGTFTNSAGSLVPILKDGYVAVVSNGEYMSGGQVKFTYDKEVGGNISVLVEPAIYIDIYLERQSGGSWVTTTMQEINSTMRPGDDIRVKYKVYNTATNEEISLSEIFGTPTEQITYCGKGYAVAEPIPLEKGNNAISVTVSVLNGSYTMYASIMCFIEENPTYYRIDCDLQRGTGADAKKATAVYTVYQNNKQIDRAGLSGYDVEIKIAYPDGTERAVDYTIGADGKMTVTFDGTGMEYGEYVLTAKVTERESQLSRSNVQRIQIIPNEFDVKCITTDSFVTSVYLLQNNSKQVEFTVTVDGQPASFTNSMISYKLTCGNLDVTNKCEIKGGNLVFNISTENLPDLSVGVQTLKLEATIFGVLNSTATYNFEIIKSDYKVEALDIGTRDLYINDLRNTQAAVYFTITKDDVVLSEDALNAAMESGEITIDTHPFGWLTMLPCGMEISVEEINGTAVVACRVFDDTAKPWDNLFSSFIFAKEKTISLSYNGVTGSDVIIIHNLSFLGRLWRWLVLLAILLFILHVILYIIGFFVAKPLPKGTMLKININLNSTAKMNKPSGTKKVNVETKEIVLWHLSRFIPFRELKDQKPREFWGMEMRVNKKTKRPELVLKRGYAMAQYTYMPTGTKEGLAVKNMLEAYARGKAPDKLGVTSRSFSKLFRRDSNEKIEKDEAVGVGDWYGILRKGATGRPDVLSSMVIFVYYTPDKKRR